MHLSINTSYHLCQEKKLRKAFLPFIHIFIVAASTISMFYFPFISEGLRVDLRLIPIILISAFHGWKYALPVVIASSLFRLGLGGPTAVQGVIFGIVLPSVIPMMVYYWRDKKQSLLVLLGVVTVSWLISDLLSAKIRMVLPVDIALFHLASLLLAFLVMYFFIITGRQQLEMTQKLQFFAERDPLTGLYNMRKFEENLDQYNPEGKRMFIAMIDIDRFKSINDRFGHQVGDAAIQSVGKILLEHCTKDMMVARYGGDEFILFIAAERTMSVKTALESIRKTIRESAVFSNSGTSSFSVSLSVGVAEFKDSSYLKETIEEADKQLYLAKKLGRDRVC